MHPQLCLARSEPTPHAIEPIGNEALTKPTGGLWTSTYLGAAQGSAYVQFCQQHGYQDWLAMPAWLLTPDPNAKICVIDSYLDLVLLAEDFRLHPMRYGSPYLNWQKISQHYDGLHLSAQGQQATRASDPGLYEWDCESTIWFRWCFLEVVAAPQRYA